MRLLIYNALLYTLSPVLLAFTVVQAIKRKGGWQFLSARLGWRSKLPPARLLQEQAQTKDPTQQQPHLHKQGNTQTKPIGDNDVRPPRRLWFHAASVGEVNSVLPLLHYISGAWPELPVVVTCTTPESLGILQSSAPGNVTCNYGPIDFYKSVNTLFKKVNPVALIVVETEIWPNLYTSAHRQHVPLIIINGRLSEKTLNAPRFILGIYQQVLKHVTLLLSRSNTDAENFKKLGVADNRVKTLGNIKTYSGNPVQATALPELENSNYLLAASTHYPEEQELCDALSGSGLLLVIAPRHIQRSSEIQQMLKARMIAFATRSRNEEVTADTRVYLADTTGEMNRLIANATIVFVGGSLIDHGGHNVLEPAIQGKAVLTGPHHKNFIAEMQLLSDHDAVCVVNDATELATVCAALLDQPARRKVLGDSARRAVESSKHVFDHYKAEIDKLIKLYY